MFEIVTLAPPDAIFGLNDAMRRDPRLDKVNLGAGVYQDEEGKTPIPRAVLEAERRLLAGEGTKTYLPIDGSPEFGRLVRELLFGAESPVIKRDRAATLQAPGGTGALRAAGDFFRQLKPRTKVWLAAPTWPNHPQIFEAAGLEVVSYPYLDAASHQVDFSGMLGALAKASPEDLVVLHGCCHNPSGVDLSEEQWRELAEQLGYRRLQPLVDIAYQGFARGVEEDAAGVRILSEILPEVFIASSYSKNFGLYRERVGALTVVGRGRGEVGAVLSHVKRCARALWSNPPAHGALLVAGVLGADDLRRDWLAELDGMRLRIRDLRKGLAAGLEARGVRLHEDGNGFLARQNGMFSFSGLTKEQVHRIRDTAAIYMVDSGRINVAGLNASNLDRVCDAVAEVVRG